MGNRQRRRRLGRPRRVCVDNIKKDLREVECGDGLDRCGSG
jgi:hypothetical protein